MIDWKKVFSSDFFFEIDRVRLHRADWVVLVIGAVLVVSGIIVVVVRRAKQNPFLRNTLTRFLKALMVIGVLELVWFPLRYEAVRWFGTRFTAGLIFLGGLIWIGIIFKDYITGYKKQTEAWEKEQIRLKYLAQK